MRFLAGHLARDGVLHLGDMFRADNRLDRLELPEIIFIRAIRKHLAAEGMESRGLADFADVQIGLGLEAIYADPFGRVVRKRVTRVFVESRSSSPRMRGAP